jgi:hypothetical protein
LTGTCDAGATNANTSMTVISYVNGSDVPGGSPTPSCSPSGVLSGAGSGVVSLGTTLGPVDEVGPVEYLEFDFQQSPTSSSESITLPSGVGSCGGTAGCVFPSTVSSTPTPEPSVALPLALGLLALIGAAKHRNLRKLEGA